jgi:hypothetical protein
MAIGKHQELVDGLFKRTKNGSLQWEEAVAPNAFQLPFKDHSLKLSEVENQDSSAPDYLLEIVNDEGRVIDSFTDVELGRYRKDIGFEDDAYIYYNIMKELYEMARRSALGSDRALNEILSSLQNDD